MDETSQFGKGATETPIEVALTRFRLAAEAPRFIDWNKGYNVENGFFVPQKNQKSASDCTCEATNYYVQALNKIDHNRDETYSERFPYSQVYIPPQGGAYIWKAMSIPLKLGVVDAVVVPDGDHTEATMRDSSLNAIAPIEARTDKYAVIPNNKDMDYLAGVVEDYHGFITGFNGNNGMFDSHGVATVPANVDWGHAVWICGYVKLPDGRKALKFKNSWGNQWGDNGYGYFPEEFVKSGLMFDLYVYADVQDLDPSSMKLTLAMDGAHYGSKVFAVVENPKTKMWIPNPETLTTGNQAGLWGGFPDIVQKDLTQYTEGVIQISVAK